MQKLITSEIDIELPALLPETFIPDIHMRLVFYKRIASTVKTDELHELKIELADRFGFLPDATKLLLELAQLKAKAQQLGITRIQLGINGGYFEFIARTKFRSDKADSTYSKSTSELSIARKWSIEY